MSKVMKHEFRVSGMRCSSCELLVKEALEELDGVTLAEASCRDGLVTVAYDPEMTGKESIRFVIEQQGFTVQD